MNTIKKSIAILLFLFTSSILFSQWNYPPTRTVDSTETYFGETIQDPYQWLEDLESPEVKDWFKAQSDYTNEVISKIPNRDILVTEMQNLDKIRKIKYSSMSERSGRYFFEKRLPGEETNKLYYRENIGSEDILLFDPQNYVKDIKYTLGSWIVSDDGKKILMGITESGKERQTLKVLNVDDKTFYGENYAASYPMDWLPESNNSFMYRELQEEDVHKMESTQNSKVKIHILGEDKSKDRVILSRENNPELKINPEDYPYIYYYTESDYIFAGKGTVDNNQEYFYAPKSQLTENKIEWKPLCTKSDMITYAVAHGDYIYFLTSKNAPNFKVIKVSLKNPDIQNAEVIMGESEKKIESIGSSKDYLIITQIHNGIESFISKMNFENEKIVQLNLPLKGSIYVGSYRPFSNYCNVWNSNWTTPSNYYSIDLSNDNFEQGPFYVNFDIPGLENLVSEEVEVISHDGERVPLSIIYDKSKVKKDGSSICYLEGYGAYGISANPFFSTFMLPMLSRGVVYALAHVRGGGEKGEKWHKAGWKTTKPNTWKDFIACAEYLVNNGYTSGDKIAGTGTSAGGILIGRAITERPDLFRVAIPKVGCMNTVRAEFSPNGPVNIPEFGTVTIEEEYKALKEMDSYMKLEEGVNYPATLVTTGFNDPRVISWIPAKFAGKMQNVNKSAYPVLLHVDYTTGHFGGESMSDYFKNLSDIYSFILWQCGYQEFQLE